jgi:preprotein translocase SecE subunit
MKTYKEDQGRLARMFAFWSLIFMLGFGCTFLYSQLFQHVVSLRHALGGARLPVLGWDLNGALLICLLVGAGGWFLVYRWQQREPVVDTLIDTEAELRKVTWPTFQEVVNSSLVVIAFVLILMGLLFVIDWFLQAFSARLLGIGS